MAGWPVRRRPRPDYCGALGRRNAALESALLYDASGLNIPPLLHPVADARLSRELREPAGTIGQIAPRVLEPLQRQCNVGFFRTSSHIRGLLHHSEATRIVLTLNPLHVAPPFRNLHVRQLNRPRAWQRSLSAKCVKRQIHALETLPLGRRPPRHVPRPQLPLKIQFKYAQQIALYQNPPAPPHPLARGIILGTGNPFSSSLQPDSKMRRPPWRAPLHVSNRPDGI